MIKRLFALILLLIPFGAIYVESQNPKREFRGAWMHTVFQEQYHRNTTEQNKVYLREQLDKLKDAGVNAIIFQVRPQSDAFYESRLEPWSRFLTDDGKKPVPYWDPLQFMIEESHARGMELHAWLNPYRVTSSKNQTLPASHIYHKHPERFVRFDGKLYFDPGLPQNREFIVNVVEDIIDRYDVDGIHFDDYFYPYPVKGVEFDDKNTYERFGAGMDLGDWRRRNVDLLIEDIHQTISETKPWIIFGISPFGIWRNKSSDPRGSDTKGLQNYDALYADVLLWAKEGWIDYNMPQLYWEFEHKAAPYGVLVDWWNKNAEGRNLYIGQSVTNTMKFPDNGRTDDATQLRSKVNLTRDAKNIQGNCWWPAYDVTANHSGVADSLMIDFQATVALVPEYPWISDRKPAQLGNVEYDGNKIVWDKPVTKNSPDDAVKFVVYHFEEDEKIDVNNSEAIECITWENEFAPEYPGVYVVTALSRVNQESRPSVPVIVSE